MIYRPSNPTIPIKGLFLMASWLDASIDGVYKSFYVIFHIFSLLCIYTLIDLQYSL